MDGPAPRLAETQTARRGRQDSRGASGPARDTPRLRFPARAPRTPTKLRLLSPLPTVNFLRGREFCGAGRRRGESGNWSYTQTVWKGGRGAEARQLAPRGGSGPAASGCLPHPTLSSRPQSPGPGSPVCAQEALGRRLLLPLALTWPPCLSVCLEAEHTCSPVTGSVQTRTCTLQSLMKFVLTPKSTVMRGKLVHSLTRQLQTAALKSQRDMFLLSPGFNE